ncbi:unnamed protein product [Toxocara canis]|uniref:BTP domain-containing protein n=1 Tax=Toxocara canis TaxID=6265 RepID=A0A183V9U8_TOXCA|nr:unnamed protein product [Toxocara canis]
MGSNRPLDPAEDYARFLVQQATARILENTGFAQASERALATLSDITRMIMEKMWTDAKGFAEHAGRRQPNFSDAHMVFQKLHFNVTELHDYLQQTFPIPPERKLGSYNAVPSVVPNYTTDTDGPSSSCAPQANSCPSSDRRGSRTPKCRVPFPDFTGLTAKDLGLVRQKRAAITVSSKGAEPSGISSSANVSAAHAAANNTSGIPTTKLKHRKPNAAEVRVPSFSCFISHRRQIIRDTRIFLQVE